MQKKHVNLKVTGLVQGVFFRASAKEVAEKLKVAGFAKNDPDGTVYIEAEGEEKALDKFISWCKKGPEYAKVEDVLETPGELKHFEVFEVYFTK
jgi:acylphosphatase